MKNEKTNLIIWAVVALVIGVIIGTFLIAPVTNGQAKAALTPIGIVDKIGYIATTGENGEMIVIPSVVDSKRTYYPTVQSACCGTAGANEGERTVHPNGSVTYRCQGTCATVQR